MYSNSESGYIVLIENILPCLAEWSFCQLCIASHASTMCSTSTLL